MLLTKSYSIDKTLSDEFIFLLNCKREFSDSKIFVVL